MCRLNCREPDLKQAGSFGKCLALSTKVEHKYILDPAIPCLVMDTESVLTSVLKEKIRIKKKNFKNALKGQAENSGQHYS